MQAHELFNLEEMELVFTGPEDPEEIIVLEEEDFDLDDTSEFNPKGPADDADNWSEDDTDEIDLSSVA